MLRRWFKLKENGTFLIVSGGLASKSYLRISSANDSKKRKQEDYLFEALTRSALQAINEILG